MVLTSLPLRTLNKNWVDSLYGRDDERRKRWVVSGLVGGLGVGSASYYYQELAKAHAECGAVMNLVMVHADVNRMLRWAATGETNLLAEYLSGLIGRHGRCRGAARWDSGCDAAYLRTAAQGDYASSASEHGGRDCAGNRCAEAETSGAVWHAIHGRVGDVWPIAGSGSNSANG